MREGALCGGSRGARAAFGDMVATRLCGARRAACFQQRYGHVPDHRGPRGERIGEVARLSEFRDGLEKRFHRDHRTGRHEGFSRRRHRSGELCRENDPRARHRGMAWRPGDRGWVARRHRSVARFESYAARKQKARCFDRAFVISLKRKTYAAFFSSMPSTRFTAVGSSVFSTAATSRAIRARAAS